MSGFCPAAVTVLERLGLGDLVMSAAIVSHRPGLKILVTKRKKSTLVTGRGGILSNPQSFDLAPALGDKGTCTTSKNLYGYHGEFHIILPDMPFDFGGQDGIQATVDSPYGLIEPMDVVEIQMDRDVKTNMPVVMRGLVRSVGRDETVGEDGRPMRRVSIVGQDFGAIFTISQLWLMVGLRDGDVFLPRMEFQQQTGLVYGPVPVEEFMQAILDIANDSIESTGITVKPAFGGVPGHIIPSTMPAMEGPVWVTMIRFSDSPWNELFVRDPATGKNPELVFRETPWKTIDGIEFGDFSGVETFDVEMTDVLSISAHRDDSGVANFIWVDQPAAWINAHWQQLISPAAQEVAKEAEADPNSTRKIYGDRLLSQTSNISPGTAAGALPEDEQKVAWNDWWGWRKKRIRWLRKATEDNADFEQGSITVKGNPKYQVGNYLKLKRGVPWEAYIVGVTHEYHAYHEYLTTIEFIRGTGFIGRVNTNDPWDLERKQS
jgi:hypothetical protein